MTFPIAVSVDLAALGAFFSGVGAVISALISVRLVQKRMKKECTERVEEIKKAIHEGYEMKG
jgi:hypothetical protein